MAISTTSKPILTSLNDNDSNDDNNNNENSKTFFLAITGVYEVKTMEMAMTMIMI